MHLTGTFCICVWESRGSLFTFSASGCDGGGGLCGSTRNLRILFIRDQTQLSPKLKHRGCPFPVLVFVEKGWEGNEGKQRCDGIP